MPDLVAPTLQDVLFVALLPLLERAEVEMGAPLPRGAEHFGHGLASVGSGALREAGAELPLPYVEPCPDEVHDDPTPGPWTWHRNMSWSRGRVVRIATAWPGVPLEQQVQVAEMLFTRRGPGAMRADAAHIVACLNAVEGKQ